jgi:hypothetical protein
MRTLAYVLLLPAVLPLFGQTTDSKADPKQPTPTVSQAGDGDRWMLLGDKPLIFKVDPVSTGSDTLVVGTEEMPPGNKIPTHKHLYEDEVIFVHKGGVRVTFWSSVRRTNGSHNFHPARELDRRGECLQRASDDPILFQ